MPFVPIRAVLEATEMFNYASDIAKLVSER